ncbi:MULTISPECIES: chemotaxis protein CheB [Paenibacillus]|uniref:chemotaxis protein CheB n=1 Tax=Paenibacillus TaxID=44249 RepID=UPI0022B932CE|nr:chemotaxis protein CheB [Paenibacillus caseinilyticus]MCZ8518620.1 chemotaxis protein CheB [Paenibacillus caseinilyticus]
MKRYETVVVGVSAGGLKALSVLLGCLPADYPLPVLVVQHLLEGSDGFLAEALDSSLRIRVREAVDKLQIEAGCVYLAPAGYHLLVEEGRTLSLSVDPRVNYSRPSVDVLFESAAYVYGPGCIGVVLTGANGDGSAGLARIAEAGGLTVVQDPEEAEYTAMPKAAIEAVNADYILPLEGIGSLLGRLAQS